MAMRPRQGGTPRSATKAGGERARTASTAAKPRPPTRKVPFPKRKQAPSHGEFVARLPASTGKRFEAVRAFLIKHGAAEELFFFGPRTGWAYRYLRGGQSLCSLVALGDSLVGIVALDAEAQANVDWSALSDVARKARKVAHGTPALLWLDVPLEAGGASDFRQLLKAKLGG
jgi:hypothetical protein